MEVMTVPGAIADVAIIGGGFSGALVAVHSVRLAGALRCTWS
jgi:hypothetical protein